MGTVQFSATGVADFSRVDDQIPDGADHGSSLLKKPAICAGEVTLVPCTHKESTQAKWKSFVLATRIILGTCVIECQLTSVRLVLQVSDRAICML